VTLYCSQILRVQIPTMLILWDISMKLRHVGIFAVINIYIFRPFHITFLIFTTRNPYSENTHMTGCSRLELQACLIAFLNSDLFIALEVCEYVAELGIFCGVWIQKSEHKTISVTISQVEMGPAGRSKSWGWWLPDMEMHWLWLRDFVSFNK
jgi:hypothetical protein